MKIDWEHMMQMMQPEITIFAFLQIEIRIERLEKKWMKLKFYFSCICLIGKLLSKINECAYFPPTTVPPFSFC